jgi:hypothetical protein
MKMTKLYVYVYDVSEYDNNNNVLLPKAK